MWLAFGFSALAFDLWVLIEPMGSKRVEKQKVGVVEKSYRCACNCSKATMNNATSTRGINRGKEHKSCKKGEHLRIRYLNNILKDSFQRSQTAR